ncbi:hypothetical protein BG004_004133 [Podila humilis]|nr:hypothetical protein BG004_004133 [Podila humilis]
MSSKLFFTPQIPSKAISLALPGITSQARDTVAELLEKNHTGHHCFFNEKGFHNHLAHGVLASYSLGASPARLRAIYKSHEPDQRPVGPVLKKLSSADWKSELGHHDFYPSYLEFFKHEVSRLGRVGAIVQYAFDHELIGRTFSGAFHPIIHLGYGVDFGIDAMVVEGLASLAVTKPTFAAFVVPPVSNIEHVTTEVLNHLKISKDASSSHSTMTIVEILKTVQNDRELDTVTSYERPKKLNDVAESKLAASKVQKLVSQWKVAETSEDIDLKAKELYKACVLAVGGTGLRNGKVKQDFFLMHALTSVIFVHKLVHALPPQYAVSCLKSHLSACVGYYISRGRPSIDVDALLNYRGTSTTTVATTTAQSLAPSTSSSSLSSSNPWLSVIKRAIDIDEVHVTKVVRSCAFGDLLFGAEQDSFSPLLLNTAQIALDLKGEWEFEGVGWPETWKK